jgi:hypothetical protein
MADPGTRTALYPAADEATATADAMVAAQVRDVRECLLRDGAAAGIGPVAIGAEIDRAVATYAHRRVRTFVGVLVERTVRERLVLRRPRD